MKPVVIVLLLAMPLFAQSDKSSVGTSGTAVFIPKSGNLPTYECHHEGRAMVCTMPTSGISIALSSSPVPQPEWVPDPSAGHYDCPDGWMAMISAEPEKWHIPNTFVNGMAMGGGPPNLDKKGHILRDRPSPPICIQDVKP